MITQIWTIGHSTRSIDDFIAALQANEIKLVADVRLLPGSKRHPQFNKEAFADSLDKEGISYAHFPELGGRRRPKPDSHNTAWRNDAFRGYADHMETKEFHDGIARLLDAGGAKRANRDHVRGSSLVALPSRAHFRFPESARHGSDSHHRCQENTIPSLHLCRAHHRWSPDLQRRRPGKPVVTDAARRQETPGLRVTRYHARNGNGRLGFVRRRGIARATHFPSSDSNWRGRRWNL